MRIDIFLLASLITTILLTSCVKEKEVEFKVPFTGKRLVIYGYISPNQPVSIQLNTTVPPIHDDEADDKVTGATVLLYENGNLIEELASDDGETYISPSEFIPQAGNVYMLEANAPNYPTAIGIDTVPIAIELSLISLEFNSDSTTFSAEVAFDDPPSIDNFYGTQIEQYKDEELIGAYPQSIHNSGGYNPLCSSVFLYLPKESSHRAFSDICFYGEMLVIDMVNYPTTIRILDENYIASIEPYDTFKSKLYTYSPTLYKHAESIEAYEYTFGDFFLEQSQVWSNIEGGYGVFCAYNTSTVTINF